MAVQLVASSANSLADQMEKLLAARMVACWVVGWDEKKGFYWALQKAASTVDSMAM